MILDFILGAIPSWVWLVLGAAAILAVVGVLKGDGWKWAFGIAAAAGLAFLQSRAHQRGAASERAKQDAADEKARDIIHDNREEMGNLPDDELDRRLNRWDKS